MKAVLFYLSLLEDLVSPAAGRYMIKSELPYIVCINRGMAIVSYNEAPYI